MRTVRIAFVGSRGVPAAYGGFETLTEEVGARLAAAGHDVVVYCRNPGQTATTHRGMTLVNLPAARRKAFETLTHTGLSVCHPSLAGVDAALVMNCANGVFLPVLAARGIPAAVHVDGLEWQRAKWGRAGRRWYLASERLVARLAPAIVADAAGIAEYWAARWGRPDAHRIAYGAPRRRLDPGAHRLAELGLEPGGYHLAVARFEPENHVAEIVAGYRASTAALPLVVVGDAPYADAYKAAVSRAASGDGRVRLLGRVDDGGLLDDLYGGARLYLHGHSVGGTNPSLLRAMGAAAAVAAWDCTFNREVLGPAGWSFFADAAGVAAAVERAEADPAAVTAAGAAAFAAAGRYDWDAVAAAYETLFAGLAGGPVLGPAGGAGWRGRRRPDRLRP